MPMCGRATKVVASKWHSIWYEYIWHILFVKSDTHLYPRPVSVSHGAVMRSFQNGRLSLTILDNSSAGVWLQPYHWVTVTRTRMSRHHSCEDLKKWVIGFGWSDRSEKWRVPRYQGCRNTYQIAERYSDSETQSRGSETSLDLTGRHTSRDFRWGGYLWPYVVSWF